VKRLQFSDNRMDNFPFLDIVQELEKAVESISPTVIYTHHYGDLNIDHRITNQAVLTAFRPTPTCSVREINCFEVMSSTEWAISSQPPFLPNHFVDISNYLQLKMDALHAYKSEMREAPHSRNITHLEYLAKHRGNMVGFSAAEAFMKVRCLR
jgi:LmbE family N-acetylglucosaminyl deacetylase